MAKEELRIDVTTDTSKAESDLKGLDRLADQTDLDLQVDTKGLGDAKSSLRDMADSAGGLPGPLGAAAGLMTGPAGIAATAVGAAGGMLALADSAADAALDAKALQTAVGGSVEETSALLAATESVGLEYNDVLELIAESNKAIGANADEAKRLGVNLEGSPVERFQSLVDAVYAIEDPLDRAATASKFFGEEGSKQLPKVIGMWGSLGAAIENVPESKILSDEDVENSITFKQAMSGLTTQLTALGAELGRTLIPALTALAEGATFVASQGDKAAGSFGVFVDSFGNLLQGDWDGFVNGTDRATTAVEDLTDAGTGAGTAIGVELVGGMSAAFDAATDMVGVLEEQRDATEEAKDANEDLRDSLFGSADAALEADRANQDMRDTMKAFADIASPTTDDVRKLNDSIFEFAEKQVAAAGTTRDTTEGSKLYKDALNAAASVLGDQMNPELQTYIDKANAVPTDAITDIRGELDPAEFDEAARLGEDLRRNPVVVQITANTKAFTDAAARVVESAFGGRAQQSTAARYVWRNGRYVETS